MGPGLFDLWLGNTGFHTTKNYIKHRLLAPQFGIGKAELRSQELQNLSIFRGWT